MNPKFRSPEDILVTSFPSKKIFPESGLISPAMILSNVVLPAPVGPRIMKYSLSFISRDTLSRALKFLKDLEMSFNFMSTICISPFFMLKIIPVKNF